MIELPVCRHRGEPDSAGRFPCGSPRLLPLEGKVVTAEMCLRCGVADRAGAAPRRARHPILQLCRHLGTPVGLRDCVTCLGKTKLKVFRCNFGHGDVTTADCATRDAGRPCPDHAT